MKVRLDYDDHRYEISIEPETEIEKCALDYLAGRPREQVIIRNTRLGVFAREEKK